MAEAHEAAKIPLAERVDYLTLVASLAAADGVASGEELDAIHALGERLGLDDAQRTPALLAARERDPERSRAALERLARSDLRFTLLADCLALAHADGSVAPDEDEAIRGLAGALGVGSDQLSVLRDYAAALRKAAAGAPEAELKSVGEQVASRLAAVGIPLGALAVGSAYGASAVGIGSGVAALAIGLGIAGGLGVAIGLGIGTMMGVRWLHRRLARG
jgi:uncharacterized tellurite resistance protein B-like protein